MQLNELGDFLQNQFDYPVESTTVRDRIGQETIDSEEETDGRTINSILDNHADEEFASVNELHQTLIGELPDEYIGRKFYDDRGSNPGQAREGEKMDEAESL
mgnify:CR=1 FL=1